jgi:hypothetical protein
MGLRSGCFSPTVMTAIRVGVRSRSPRVWSDLVASDSGGFRAGDWWGCCRVTLCGLRSPLRLVDLGYAQTVLPELDPRARVTGRSWLLLAVVDLGPRIALRCRWLTAERVAMPRPAGCLVGVSGPSSRDASSKATPVYHPRG